MDVVIRVVGVERDLMWKGSHIDMGESVGYFGSGLGHEGGLKCSDVDIRATNPSLVNFCSELMDVLQNFVSEPLREPGSCNKVSQHLFHSVDENLNNFLGISGSNSDRSF